MPPFRDAGLELPDRSRAEDLKGHLVNCFKSEADQRGKLRGRRQIMLDDSDVHHHHHSKAGRGRGGGGGGPVIAIWTWASKETRSTT